MAVLATAHALAPILKRVADALSGFKTDGWRGAREILPLQAGAYTLMTKLQFANPASMVASIECG